MEGPFIDGVSYLSRAEEATARRLEAQRQDRASITDIKIRDTDTATLQFMQRVRQEVLAWKNSLLVRLAFLSAELAN